jgi:hypothetical protein
MTQVRIADQINLMLVDGPGVLASVAEALQNANVNIEGSSAIKVGGVGVRLVVDNVEAAKAAIGSMGTMTLQKTVVVKFEENKPGMIAKAARALGDAGISIENFYHAASGSLFIIVSDADTEKAAETLKAI